MSMYDGTIKLSFVSRNGRTVAKDTYRSGNSRISSSIPTNDGTPYYFLIATGGVTRIESSALKRAAALIRRFVKMLQ